MGIAAFTAARDSLLEAADDATLTGEAACSVVARAISRVARCDALALMSTDHETHLPAGGVVAGFEPAACVPFWDNELLDPDFNKFNDLARRVEPVASLSDATDGDVERSPRFQKLYSTFDGSDELRVAFMAGATCLAIGAFVRTDGDEYSPTEVRDVTALLKPSIVVLRRALHQPDSAATSVPAVLIIDRDGAMVSATSGAEAQLDDLRIDIDSEIPGTILIAASKARRRGVDRVTTRVRGRSGCWFRVHAAALDGGPDHVVVTIDRATASDLVPMLLSSYGLSNRETEIVLALCRGLGTKELASELGISSHTVRDHLKVVFAKADVNSRGELVARLFTEQVLDQFEEAVIQL
ncbi:helix-turn-helix transcriptional regulator [Ilumatobacter nonamiensis]|uniref:helix-turn-helix transcriptional regulator n=1 Tax=Ilumatobacter nonamiensis TaxID=467093 RepID=UPI0003482E56|nr:helix-turn-helix transcriptional regulator [Ilumatobacter nonamiensis]